MEKNISEKLDVVIVKKPSRLKTKLSRLTSKPSRLKPKHYKALLSSSNQVVLC